MEPLRQTDEGQKNRPETPKPPADGSSAVDAGNKVAAMPRRQVLVILGMHRSGTSALTRVLNLLGGQVPQTLMGGDESNTTGHWESTVVRALNDDVLASGGSHWQDWHAFQPRWYDTAEPDFFLPRALQVLNDEFDDAPMIVFKDPRVCRIFPFWRSVFAEAGLEPRIVLAVRHPVEVAASLDKRNGLSVIHGLLLWLRHVLEAEHASRGMVRAVVSFESFITNPRNVAVSLQDQLGVIWPRLSEYISEKIDGFVDPSLRHHVSDDQRKASDAPVLRSWLAEVYGIMLRWSESGEDTADHAALNKMRQSLNDLSTPLHEVIATLDETNSEKKTLRETVRNRDAERVELKTAVETLTRQSTTEKAELQEALNTSKAERAAADKAAEAARADLTRQNEVLQEALNTSKAERAAADKAAEAARADLTRQNEAMQAELREAQDRLSQTESALRQRAHEADQTATALRAANAVLADREHQNSELRTELSRTEERLAQQKTELEKAQNRLEKKEAELLQVREQGERDLAQRFEELGALTRQLIDRENSLGDEGAQLSKEVAAMRQQPSVHEEPIKTGQSALSDVVNENTALLAPSEQDHGLAGRMSETIRAIIEGGVLGSHPVRRVSDRRKARLLQALGLFDASWYARYYSDVREAGADPAMHFVRNGFAEGRASSEEMLILQNIRPPDGSTQK